MPARVGNRWEDPGFIYAIRRVCGGEIKIGWTGNAPARRLHRLALDVRDSLELLAVVAGTRREEKLIHAGLVAHACRRLRHYAGEEWYSPHADVLQTFHDWPQVEPPVRAEYRARRFSVPRRF